MDNGFNTKDKTVETGANKGFKMGFATLIARPNVGKSTLLNKIAGQKIAITSPVAQTTRYRIKCIYTDNNSQIVFIDTPGVHKPLNKLGEFLSNESKTSLEDSDIILFLVDVSDKAGAGDRWIVENYLKNINKPVLIVANKVDRAKKEKLELNVISYKELFDKNYPVIKISAKTGKNISSLLEKIKDSLPFGDIMYPDDEVTDQNLRAIASEIIREKNYFKHKG